MRWWNHWVRPHTFDPSTLKAEADRSQWVRGQPRLHSECQDSQDYTERPCHKTKQYKLRILEFFVAVSWGEVLGSLFLKLPPFFFIVYLPSIHCLPSQSRQQSSSSVIPLIESTPFISAGSSIIILSGNWISQQTSSVYYRPRQKRKKSSLKIIWASFFCVGNSFFFFFFLPSSCWQQKHKTGAKLIVAAAYTPWHQADTPGAFP